MPKRKETVLRYKNVSIHRREVLETVNIKSVEYLQMFLQNHCINDYNPKTTESMIADIIRWLEYIYENQGDKCIADLITEDLEQYVYHLKMVRNNQARTINRILSEIESVYAYLKRKGIISENPASAVTRPSYVNNHENAVKRIFLTEEQVDDLKLKLEENGNIQLQTYINFTLSTAVRAGACSTIRWEQIDFDKRMVTDVLEKKSKLVTLYFNEYTKSLLLKLQEYRKNNHIQDGGYLFISDRYRYYSDTGEKTHISSGTLSKWANKAGAFIDVPELSAHDLRRTSANLLLQRGGDIGLVSLLLNHDSISTTFKYYVNKTQNEYLREYKDKYDF